MSQRWYPKGHFFPRNITAVPAYQNLTKSGKRIYFALCRHSYLTKKKYKRRYVAITKQQLAEEIGCCTRTVQRQLQLMLKSRLLIRWFDGTSGPSGSNSPVGEFAPRSVGATLPHALPPRYELPASDAQITYWRIKFSSKSKKGDDHG